jgi:hypothetical protein
MATPAQIAANRRNARKSTGPRTAAGKAVSSRNALRHGLAARAAIVLGEDPADLQRFRAELRAALAPKDGREEWLAETAAEAAWRLRRVWRAEAALVNRSGRLDVAPSRLRDLLILRRYEAAANRRFHRAVAMLEHGRTLERVATSRSRLSFRHARSPRQASPCSYERKSTRVLGTFGAMRQRRGHQPNGNRSERQCQDTAAPKRGARNHGFCRRNPILGSCAGTQPLGAWGTLSARASWLGFVEKQLNSWKSVPEIRPLKRNPFEYGSTWPSRARRVAASPSADYALMTPD